MANNDGYTAGDLSPILFVKETAFGVTPATGWAYGPESLEVTKTDNIDQFKEWWGGQRTVNTGTMIAQSLMAGFDLKANERARADWISPLIEGALGSSTGTDFTSLSSYSMIVEVANNRLLYNGCKINELQILATQPKAVLEFNAKILAQYVTPMTLAGTVWSVAGLQNVTMAAPSARSEAPGVQWVKSVTVNENVVYPQNLNLTISNNLDRELGKLTGADTNAYYGSIALRGGRMSVTLEFESFLKNFTGISDQMANTPITSAVVEYGNDTISKSIVLQNGRYDVGSWAPFKNDQMSQKFKMTFSEVSIV